MAGFSQKTQQPFKPSVKPEYTYNQQVGQANSHYSSAPLPGLSQPLPIHSNVEEKGIKIPTFLQKNKR